MTKSLTKAFDDLKRKRYRAAIDGYLKLSEEIGYDFFEANIIYCRNRLLKEEAKPSNGTEASVEKILFFTNLALSTIDGSTVFIANTINLFCSLAKEVHLLCTVLPGENFRSRLNSTENFSIFQCDSSSVVDKIRELDSAHDYSKMFVRSFGDKSIWFDFSYARKIILYWTLLPNFNEQDRAYYNAVDTIAFQTEELRDYTTSQLGAKKNLLLPPLLHSSPVSDGNSFKTGNEGQVIVSYVGTLRPECYSRELLTALVSILEQRNDIIFYLLISKVFYKDAGEKKKIMALVEHLSGFPNVTVEQQASPDRCDWVLQQSDIGFSLWAPTPENIRQVSTKLLENLNCGVNTICFETPVYKNLLGENYEFFIRSPEDLESSITFAINKVFNSRKKYVNNYLLSSYRIDAHKSRLLSYFKGSDRPQTNEDCRLFNGQFDKIYGLYISETERERLKYVVDRHGIDISFFEGVNGKANLQSEYESYLRLPLLTAWERTAKKKRLTIGAMGHLYSFIKIAEDAIANSYQKILILEADVQVHQKAFLLNSLFRPENFKVMYYGAGKWNKNIKSVSEHFYTPHQTTGTFAIALDKSVLHECISEWRKFLEPTDIALQKITDKYSDQSFVFVPNLFIADVARSNTTTHRSQKDLSERFGWTLEDYVVGSVEPVGRFVKRLRFVFDHVVRKGQLILVQGGQVRSFDIDNLEFTLDVHAEVERIEYLGAFLRSLEYLDD